MRCTDSPAAKPPRTGHRTRGALVAGAVLAGMLTQAVSAADELALRRSEAGRLELVISSSGSNTLQVDVSTNLADWSPYLQVFVSNGLAFAIEPPPVRTQWVFYQMRPRTDLKPLLKPRILLPGGMFLMGQAGPYAGEYGLPVAEPVHQVTLSPFLIDACEVTMNEWRRVVAWASDPARGANRYYFHTAGTSYGPNHPVIFIDWFDVIKWANARSEMEKLDPVYFTEPEHLNVYRTGTVEVRNDCVAWEANGYRLPTEAEWEYAARGGLEMKTWPWGDEYPTSARANYRFDNSGTTPVASYPPNGYGLFDMAGNVREWCWDLHKDDPAISYTNHIVFAPYDPWPQFDPRGPDTGPRGMSRGGSWVDTYQFIQCGRRHNDERTRRTDFLGFRLVTRWTQP